MARHVRIMGRKAVVIIARTGDAALTPDRSEAPVHPDPGLDACWCAGYRGVAVFSCDDLSQPRAT